MAVLSCVGAPPAFQHQEICFLPDAFCPVPDVVCVTLKPLLSIANSGSPEVTTGVRSPEVELGTIILLSPLTLSIIAGR